MSRTSAGTFTVYFVRMRTLSAVVLLLPLAVPGLLLVPGCAPGAFLAEKAGIRVALRESPSDCHGRDCYSQDELNRFQRAASLYARKYAKITADNHTVPVAGSVVVRCRVDTTDKGTPRASSAVAAESSVGDQDFLRRLTNVFEGARLDPRMRAGTDREYHLHFSRDIYQAENTQDSTTLVILPALQWFQ
ncbi:MAG: hypothetical protein GF331_13360 [Chitinivibrionales bacterium]|nr:hypothetical protein [Chitinivibrionales bacterium]